MAKAGELWDDSALIKAFDNAISKYKIMHSKGSHDTLNEGSKVNSSTGENVSPPVEDGHKAERHSEAENKGIGSLTSATEMVETTNPSSIKENQSVESYSVQHHMDSSKDMHIHDVVQGQSKSQGSEDYTQLLNQYYELEEKRQQILQQLQQLGYSNYQQYGENTGTGLQWDAQVHQDPANQAFHSTVVCSCCPYATHCMVSPCTSLPACSLVGSCFGNVSGDATMKMGHEKTFSLKNGDPVATAMEAAKRAISSMKSVTSEQKNDEEQHDKKMEEGSSSGTDLTEVLNAWYSAGFYTGKYLTEQSIAKNEHD